MLCSISAFLCVCVEVPPPDAASRLSILRLSTRSMLSEPDSPATIEGLTQLADRLELYTGADITNICREAALNVLRENIKQEKLVREKRTQCNGRVRRTHVRCSDRTYRASCLDVSSLLPCHLSLSVSFSLSLICFVPPLRRLLP